ncbi:Myocardin-related transcription factor B [Merluccius polli]|uniref:Myocardin-related transcription factor B n=1 Tax=Merluccius polli TaxID=89951 RepID=A0AA47P4H9_MERPO|nr:Myocardin-related transcription factor B [Merluccius polli]
MTHHLPDTFPQRYSVLFFFPLPASHQPMGLQVWPPSKPPPSSMACLDVETPTVCRVLQLCLQQRRSREQLVEQGIMPPLKMPVAFHEQIRHLERARTGNFLKHKICTRPERSELVRMHILQETQAEPSLQATQMRLKRARLADDLNEKLAQRPGPMELVVKNILPVVDAADTKDPPIAQQGNDPKIQDVYNFDENSTDSQPAAESAEQTSKQTPQQATSASPREAARTESSPPPACPNHTAALVSNGHRGTGEPAFSIYRQAVLYLRRTATKISPPLTSQSSSSSSPSSDSPSLGCTTEQPNKHLAVLTTVASPVRGPILVKQSQPRSAAADKNRGKKGNRDPKPRVKKLKYHQYVPPDQKQDAGHEAPLDSAYVRLLQQQQQFLQLQILNQRYSGGKGEKANVTNLSTAHAAFITSDGPAHSKRTPPPSMSHHLPYNVDEMKVAELRAELKLRGLLVSGTKNDLIERLRSHHDKSKGGPPALEMVSPAAATAAAPTARVPKSENTPRSTPPVSPVAFKVSSMGLDERGGPDPEPHSTPPGGSPHLSSTQEEAGHRGGCRSLEKDQRLHEKERQIEELMRQLEREQRLVEELKMQLEVEKRGHQEESALRHSPSLPVRIKEEFCGSPVGVEPDRTPEQSRQLSPPHQFFLTCQERLSQTQTMQPGTRQLQPVSTGTVKLPDNRRHTAVTGVAPDSDPTQGLMPQKHEASGSLQQQCHCPSPRTQSTPLSTSPGPSSQVRATQSQAEEDTALHLLNTAPPTMTLMSICKDPPRYEDAVKQTRCMQTAMQVPTALSQHMDDLFDVLIESGEIMPFIKQDPSCPDKLLPVTANVTTLPINTVLSRPPAQIQVAQPPDATLHPSSSLMALVTMETLIEGTLHKQLLEHPLVSHMELDFSDHNTLPPAGHLHNANLDTMNWLDLTTLPSHGHEEAVSHLEMSPEAGVFSSDFLESPEFQLNWE